MAIKVKEPHPLSIINIKLNNNNNSDNTQCVCHVWLCQYGHWSSALLNDFPAPLVFLYVSLFVCQNNHTGLSQWVLYIFLWFIPKGTDTLHTHCMSEIIREKKRVSGREEELRRRGEELCLDIINFLKTTTTTFALEIIGYTIGGVSPDTGFQLLQSIITTRRYMESNKETFKMVLLRPNADLLDQSWWSATNNTQRLTGQTKPDKTSVLPSICTITMQYIVCSVRNALICIFTELMMRGVYRTSATQLNCKTLITYKVT